MELKLSETQRIKISSSDDLYGIMQEILLDESLTNQSREQCWVIGLENNHRILYIELISLGTINKTLVEPMEVFSLALRKKAVKIILCHNHPSGELKPSDADRNITDCLIQVGSLINIQFLDHLIISDKSYLSFKDNGLLEMLERNSSQIPCYTRIKRAKLEATKLAKQKKKIEIAKTMKRESEKTHKIALFTGLSENEIENLRVKRK